MPEPVLSLPLPPDGSLRVLPNRRVQVCTPACCWTPAEFPASPGRESWAATARAMQAGLDADPAVPPDAVADLAAADRPDRMRVVGSASLALWQTWVLAHDEDWWVRAALARRLGSSEAPAEVLRLLVEDAQPEVRRTLARTPGCPAWALTALASDPDALAREAAERGLAEASAVAAA